MLALARTEGQSIIIDGNIEVKVVKWSRSSVRLAIQAPRQVTVDRDEIWRKEHPGELTPLEKAEEDRKERFAKEGLAPGEFAVRAPAAGIFHPTKDLAAGNLLAPGTVVGTIEDAEGKPTEVRTTAKGSFLRLAAAEGAAVTPGQLLLIIQHG